MRTQKCIHTLKSHTRASHSQMETFLGLKTFTEESVSTLEGSETIVPALCGVPSFSHPAHCRLQSKGMDFGVSQRDCS